MDSPELIQVLHIPEQCPQLPRRQRRNNTPQQGLLVKALLTVEGHTCPWRNSNFPIISDSWPLLLSSTNTTLGRYERSLLPSFSPAHHPG